MDIRESAVTAKDPARLVALWNEMTERQPGLRIAPGVLVERRGQ